MNRLASGLAIAALWAAGAGAEPLREPPVAVSVDHLPHHVRERVRAKADQGITALVRYLELTRTVYQLRLMDVLPDSERSEFARLGPDAREWQIEQAAREGRTRGFR